MELAVSSYGPDGRSKILQSDSLAADVIVAITAHSVRLFQHIRTESLVSQFVLNQLQAQASRGDCGLFMIALTVKYVPICVPILKCYIDSWWLLMS